MPLSMKLPEEILLMEQVKAYFAEANLQTMAGAVVLSIVSFASYRWVSVWAWLPSLLVVYLVTFLRMRNAWAFAKDAQQNTPAEWGAFQTWGAGVAGAAWGVAFVLMLPDLDVGYRLLIVSLSAVSVAAAVSEGFSYPWPSRAFSLLLMLPLIGWLVLSGERLHLTLAVLLAIFLPLTLWRGNEQSKVFVRAIEMGFHNERLAAELALQRDRAEQASKAKSRFLAAASHDLRQPIAAITAYVDTLKFTSPSPAKQRELVDKLAHATAVISSQLDLLLDISKLDAGAVQPSLRPYRLNELFGWVVATYAQQAEAKGLEFRLRLPADNVILVRADKALLESILMNLVANAIKFTRAGGVLVAVRIRKDSVLVQVWDTGIGIDASHREHIFDEFFQVGNPQRDRRAGFGLGLAISQRAAGLLGSAISCRSRPGRGTVFEFELPRVAGGGVEKGRSPGGDQLL